jgi:predicted RNase H-like HicB family nuclease
VSRKMATEALVFDPKEILKRPYARILTPDPDGRFTAEIMEFPGCVAFGDDAANALANLNEVASEWIVAAVEQGQEIPDPMDSADFSGKLVLRMSKGLHRRAALCAEREGVSLNQFITTCLAEAVGERARPMFVQAPATQQLSANLSVQMVVGGPVTTYAQLLQPHQISTPVGMPVMIPAQFLREKAHARG